MDWIEECPLAAPARHVVNGCAPFDPPVFGLDLSMPHSNCTCRYFYGRGVDDDKGGIVPVLQVCVCS